MNIKDVLNTIFCLKLNPKVCQVKWKTLKAKEKKRKKLCVVCVYAMTVGNQQCYLFLGW